MSIQSMHYGIMNPASVFGTAGCTSLPNPPRASLEAHASSKDNFQTLLRLKLNIVGKKNNLLDTALDITSSSHH